jgi:hypothetical protein
VSFVLAKRSEEVWKNGRTFRDNRLQLQGVEAQRAKGSRCDLRGLDRIADP